MQCEENRDTAPLRKPLDLDGSRVAAVGPHEVRAVPRQEHLAGGQKRGGFLLVYPAAAGRCRVEDRHAERRRRAKIIRAVRADLGVADLSGNRAARTSSARTSSHASSRELQNASHANPSDSRSTTRRALPSPPRW